MNSSRTFDCVNVETSRGESNCVSAGPALGPICPFEREKVIGSSVIELLRRRNLKLPSCCR